MGTAFIAGKTPMIVSGSWWYGRFKDEIKSQLGLVPVPGQHAQRRLVGQPVGRPDERARPRSLAYDFIDITMRPEIQDLIGNNGGLPVAGDPRHDQGPEGPAS